MSHEGDLRSKKVHFSEFYKKYKVVMKIIKNHGYVLFLKFLQNVPSANPSEMAKRLFAFVIKVWRDLRKIVA
jgi:hypothetical protein